MFLVLGTVVVTVGPAWRASQWPCTVAHELGHAYVGRVLGRAVTGIRLQPDTSGVTHSAGGRGVGLVLMLGAGYTAPPLVGAWATWCALHGWAGAGVLVLAFLLLLGFPLARNVFAFVVMGVAALVFGWVAWRASVPVMTGVLQATGVYLGVAGVRSVSNLAVLHHHSVGEGSDASQLSQSTGVPARVWVVVFGVVAVAAAGWQVLVLTRVV